MADSDYAALEARVAQLEKILASHQGPKRGASQANTPHPELITKVVAAQIGYYY